MMNHSWKTMALLIVASSFAGCGGNSNPWNTVYPVKGVVKFEGKPVSGAQVFLVPIDSKAPESIRPSAISGADGSFEVGTHSAKDGAPAGEYRVAVIWHPLVPTEGGPVRGDNKLPARYAKPETSDLKTTVTADSNGITLTSFELKK